MKTNKIDQKIKNILKDLQVAHKMKEEFLGSSVTDQKIVPKDIFEMGLAYANEDRLLVELELAQSQKYPNLYSNEDIKRLEEEKDRLTHRIHAFQNRQWPSQYRE